MMFRTGLFFLLFFYSQSFGEDNLIDWNAKRKLDWTDFKANPDPASVNAALTSSMIKVDFGYDERGLKHSITCRFDKLKSWVRVRNDYILNHEQGHFDLTEAYARALHKSLGEYKFDKKTVSEDLNRIYSRVMEEHVRDQDLYDTQTDHSLDTAQQLKWNLKISSMLNKYDAFKEYGGK